MPLSWTPANAVNRGSLPSGLSSPTGIAYDGTQLVIVDEAGDDLWTLPDVTSPGDAGQQG